ncbi:MAG: hypothetical protein PCFJNLEI_03857 [Verrucomicrobiae bacterium]|nr:hypothetical protein [Verrucomicrobiae bacterium]
MKAAAHIKTPAQYLASLPEPRRSELTVLHKAICRAAPALKPHIAYGGLGYGRYHYRYASGWEGDAPVVGLASQKQHIGLYTCMCDAEGYLPAKYTTRLGRVSLGKSCIRFRKLEHLNLKVAMEVVKRAAKIAKAMKYSYDGKCDLK